MEEDEPATRLCNNAPHRSRKHKIVAPSRPWASADHGGFVSAQSYSILVHSAQDRSSPQSNRTIMNILTGSCACKRITYEANAAPKQDGSTICHCKTCQKLGGAPYQVFIGMHSKTLTWFDNTDHLHYEGLPLEPFGGLRYVRLSTIADRACCVSCGSWLAMRYKATSDTTYITLGTVDTTTIPLATKEEIFLDESAGWMQQSAVTHRYPGMPK